MRPWRGAGRQITYVSVDECAQISRTAMDLLKAYAQGHVGTQIRSRRPAEELWPPDSLTRSFPLPCPARGPGHREGADEEQLLDDFLAILRLLTNLISRDFLDFSDNGSTGFTAEVFVHPDPGHVAVADVVFFGLSIVIPLLPVSMLRVRTGLGSKKCHALHPADHHDRMWNVTHTQHPLLCEQYFKLVAFLCEVYPEKLITLSPALLDSLLQSLAFGMEQYVPHLPP